MVEVLICRNEHCFRMRNVSGNGFFVSGRMNSAADYVSTPCGVVRRRRCRRWREGSN